jgi:hypothetical protein
MEANGTGTAQLVFSKVTQDPKIWAVHLGDIHKRQVFIASSFDFTGAEYAPTVSVDKDGDNQVGMLGVLAFMAIIAFQGAARYPKLKCQIITWN